MHCTLCFYYNETGTLCFITKTQIELQAKTSIFVNSKIYSSEDFVRRRKKLEVRKCFTEKCNLIEIKKLLGSACKNIGKQFLFQSFERVKKTAST